MAAVGAVGVAAGCDAYGVVDPLPTPTCYSRSSLPKVTARYVKDLDAGALPADSSTDAGDGGAATGTEAGSGATGRFVEINVPVDDAGVTFTGEVKSSMTIVDKSITPAGVRIVVLAPVNGDTGYLELGHTCAKGHAVLRIDVGFTEPEVTLNLNVY
jgi:hypothetical protein